MIRCQAILPFSICARLGVWLACAVTLASAPIALAQTDQQYNLAAGLYARGQWEDAEKAFSKLISSETKPDHAAAAAFFLAEAMMQQGKFDQAFTAFQTFVRQYPEHPYAPRATFRMGEGAFRTNRFDVAVRLLEAFAKENPNHELNEFALPYLGQLRNLRLEPQLAQMAFESALKFYPDGTMANSCRLGLAKALQAQSHVPGNQAEAKRFYLYLKEQFEPAIAAEARIQLGMMSIDALDFEEAETSLKDALKITSDSELRAKANYWLARIQLEQEDYEIALAQLRPLTQITLPPNLMTSIWFDAAVAATRKSPPEYSQAITWLSQIRNEYPKSKRLASAVRFEIDLLRKTERFDEALQLAKQHQFDDYEQLIAQQTLEHSARQWYEHRKFSKAAEAFAKLIENAVASGQGNADQKIDGWRYLQSLSLIGLAQFQIAESILQDIEQPSEPSELYSLCDLALATTRFGQHKYKQAIEDYQSYLRWDGDSAEAIRAKTELAICLAKTSMASEASRVLASVDRDKVELIDAYETAIEIVAESCVQQDQTELAADWLVRLQKWSQNPERIRRLHTRIALASVAKVGKVEVVSTKSFLTLLENERQDDLPGEPLSGNRHAICQAALAFATQLPESQSEDAKKIYASLIETTSDQGLANIARIQLARMLQKQRGKRALAKASQLLNDYLDSGSLEQQPVKDEVIYQLAWLSHDSGDRRGFQDRLEQLLDDQPASKYWADAAYRLIKIYAETQRFSKANGLIERLLAEDRVPIVPREILARTRFLEGKIAVAQNEWTAVESAMTAAQALPLSDVMKTQAIYWTAESLFQQGKYQVALSTFELLRQEPHSSRLTPKHRPWVELRTAQANAKLEKWFVAEQHAREAIRRFQGFPRQHEFHFLIARSLEQKGLLVDAKVEFERAIELAPGTEIAAMAQWRIGEACFHQEEYAKAIEAYYKVDSLYDFPKWRSAALVQAGKCQERLNNLVNARKLYQQLINTFPNSKHVAEAKQRLAKIVRNERTAVRSAGANR